MHLHFINHYKGNSAKAHKVKKNTINRCLITNLLWETKYVHLIPTLPPN